MQFTNKSSVDAFLKTQDFTQTLSKICAPIPKLIAKENPEMFDRICEAIESATVCVEKYNGFVATMTGKGFTQISYEASRVPRAYAFVCILKQWLPE